MSAFLAYSNAKRTQVKAKYPNAASAEISKFLAHMWKHAPEEERKIHIDKEFALRQDYKIAIAKWRENADNERKAAMKQREDFALQKVDAAGDTRIQDPLAVTPRNTSESNGVIYSPSQTPNGVEPYPSPYNRTQHTEFYPDALPTVAYGGSYEMYAGTMGAPPAVGTPAATHGMMIPSAHPQAYQHQVNLAQNGPGTLL